MNAAQIGFFIALGVSALFLVIAWMRAARLGPESNRPTLGAMGVGALTSFLDTLGIGSFAPTTALFKLFHMVKDELIPGTLNVGLAASGVAEATIFVKSIEIDPALLAATISSAAVGAWLGAGVVSRLPRRAIQIGMGVALMVAAALFIAKNTELIPGGGDALGLHGGVLVFAVAVSYLLGALMMLGIGLYAPCLIMVSLLGMNPLTAFPIMMGSCAFLMPIGGERFVRAGRYDRSAALALAIGGIPGVLIAAFIVKSLPLVWLRWLVVVVVLYASVQMLRSAVRERASGTARS